MAVMLGALLVIPFVDRGPHEPDSSAAAFDWRRRGWAFLAMAVFWVVLIVGLSSRIRSPRLADPRRPIADAGRATIVTQLHTWLAIASAW